MTPTRAELDRTLPVSAARAGDASAWDKLFRRYQLPLFAFVCEHLADEQMALEVLQEVFVSAFRHLPQLRSNERFGSWLFAIAYQKSLQKARFLPREEPVPDNFDLESAALDETDPARELLRKEDQEALLSALDQLAEPHRSVLVLHYLQEFSLDEIAEILAIPSGTVKSRLHHARAQLRLHLNNPFCPRHENAP